MKKVFEVLIVCAALAIIGNYLWNNKEQTVSFIHRVAPIIPPKVISSIRKTLSIPEATPEPLAANSVSTPSASPVAISQGPPPPEPMSVPLLELTKIPLTGMTESFTTLEGDHYTGIIKRVEPDGIVLRTSDGVSKLKFKNLPPEVGVKYGYDPELEIQFLRYRNSVDAAAYQKAVQTVDEKANKDTTVLEKVDSLKLKSKEAEEQKVSAINKEIQKKKMEQATSTITTFAVPSSAAPPRPPSRGGQ